MWPFAALQYRLDMQFSWTCQDSLGSKSLLNLRKRGWYSASAVADRLSAISCAFWPPRGVTKHGRVLIAARLSEQRLLDGIQIVCSGLSTAASVGRIIGRCAGHRIGQLFYQKTLRVISVVSSWHALGLNTRVAATANCSSSESRNA